MTAPDRYARLASAEQRREDLGYLDGVGEAVLELERREAPGNPQVAIRAWRALELWLVVRGRWADLDRIREEAIAAAEEVGDLAALAQALASRSIHRDLLERRKEAGVDADRALRLAKASQDPRALVEALLAKAGLESDVGQNARALRRLRKAWKVAAATDPGQQAMVAYSIGSALPDTDPEATEWLTRAVNIAKANPSSVDAQRAAGFSVAAMGLSALESGDYEVARGLLVQALAAKEAIGEPRSLAIGYRMIATLELRSGEPERASENAWRASDLYRSVGLDASASDALRLAGIAKERLGHVADARAAYREALALIDPATAPKRVARLRQDLGDVALLSGDVTEALDLYAQAARAYAAARDFEGEAAARAATASALLAAGRSADASDAAAAVVTTLRSAANVDPHRLAGALILQGAADTPTAAIRTYEEALALTSGDSAPLSSRLLAVLGLSRALELRATELKAVARDLADREEAIPRSIAEVGDALAWARLMVDMGRLDRARRWLRTSEPVALASPTAAESLLGLATSLGRALEERERWIEALDAYELARRAAEASNNRNAQIVIHQDIGDVKRALDRLDEAVVEYRLAADLLAPGTRNVRNPWIAIGRLETARGNPHEAIDAFRTALASISSQDEPRRYGVVLHDIANVQRKLGEPEAAIASYEDAAKYKERDARRTDRDRADLVFTLVELGKTQQDMGDEAAAGQTFRRAAAILGPDVRDSAEAELLLPYAAHDPVMPELNNRPR